VCQPLPGHVRATLSGGCRPATGPSLDPSVWHVPHVQETHSVRRIATDQLSPDEVAQIRDLLWAAFGTGDEGFTENDWQHALGGQHFILEVDGAIASHASVVERELHIAEQPIRTGYVEAVGTVPGRQRRGYGSAVIAEVTEYIRATFDLGALGTGEHAFYERLGWQTWRGPSFVRTPGGPQPTVAEDGFILVLLTPTSPVVDFAASISCDQRTGDDW
jgi:aminoglycoside 2'-N-acetyltransferase I